LKNSRKPKSLSPAPHHILPIYFAFTDGVAVIV
jgi:hypothetical protein